MHYGYNGFYAIPAIFMTLLGIALLVLAITATVWLFQDMRRRRDLERERTGGPGGQAQWQPPMNLRSTPPPYQHYPMAPPQGPVPPATPQPEARTQPLPVQQPQLWPAPEAPRDQPRGPVDPNEPGAQGRS